ncbi:MAG TPA: hypothetical protein PKL83_02135 [bacterium]|nr:hypothetical protein [bacterium]
MQKALRWAVPLLAGTLLFTGCELFEKGTVKPSAAKDEPEKTLQESMTRAEEIKSSTTTIKLDVDAEMEGQEVSAELNMTAKTDSSDEENMLAEMSITGNVDAGAQGSITLKEILMKVVDNKMYMNIGGLEIGGIEGGDEMIAMFEDYFNKWYVIDPESDAFKEMVETTGVVNTEESELTPEQTAQVLEIVKSSDVFANVKYEGEETVDGVKCVKFSFSGLDANKVIEMINKIGAIVAPDEYEGPDEDEAAEFKEGLDMLNTTGAIWVGQDDGYVHKVQVGMDVDQDGQKATIGVEMTVSDINKDVKVEAPDDATDFMETVQELMMLFMGGTDYTDYSDYGYDDYSGYTDEELEEYMNMLETMQ